jgi:hypothetical protein
MPCTVLQWLRVRYAYIIFYCSRLKLIPVKLNNLKSRMGIETMLFVTHGSTDLPMNGVTFATVGVKNFLEVVMKTDPQDFLGKMEGFAVQGVKGW